MTLFLNCIYNFIKLTQQKDIRCIIDILVELSDGKLIGRQYHQLYQTVIKINRYSF